MLQAVHLVSEYKARHNVTLPAFKGLLQLLQAVLPENSMPATVYRFRKISNAILEDAFGGEPFRRLHLCSNDECTHVYLDQEGVHSACPLCGEPRYKKTKRGKQEPCKELRYLGVRDGMRSLLMSKTLCQAVQAFDVAAAVDCPWSTYSAKVSDHICKYFIPGFGKLTPEKKRLAKIMFLQTGQVCDRAELDRYHREVEEGIRPLTVILLVEAGCDGFQPFKRRIWTTWMYGYRVICVDWTQGESGGFEVVTAISEGASEGNAAHCVAALDAADLASDLRPPSAEERQAERMQGGVLFKAKCSVWCFSSMIRTCVSPVQGPWMGR